MISFERLNTLIETYQFYPLIIKRDKNYSASIYSVLNANKTKEEMKVSINRYTFKYTYKASFRVARHAFDC